jgi:hypothetical protein
VAIGPGAVIDVTLGWGEFRRRLTVAVGDEWPDLETRVRTATWELLRDVQRLAAEWLAAHEKPPVQVRAEAMLDQAIKRTARGGDPAVTAESFYRLQTVRLRAAIEYALSVDSERVDPAQCAVTGKARHALTAAYDRTTDDILARSQT